MSIWTKIFGKPKPEKVWKYIGKIEGAWKNTRDPNNKTISIIMFFMTDAGERKFEVVTEDPWIATAIKKGIYADHTRAKVWAAGGEFPEKLDPNTDTLGEMLNRLMDAKLTGKA